MRGRHDGFIAQEVARIFPKWISHSANNGYLMLSIKGFEALTVESFRQLNTDLDKERVEKKQLEQRVHKLEDENKQLNERLYKLERMISKLMNKANI